MTSSRATLANGTGAPPAPGPDEVAVPPAVTALLQFAAMLARGWRRIVGAALATALAAVSVALLLPKSYFAVAVLVPFAGSASRSSIALGGLPAGVAGLLGGGSPAERVLTPVLGSRTLMDTILARAAHDTTEARQVGEVLRDGVRVVRNADGSMQVQVRAPTPILAARVANTYPTAINRILGLVSTEGAVTKQAFLRTQIDTAEARLTNSEQRYIEFAARRSAPAPEQQAQRTIDAAAALQQGIFEQEIAIGQLRRTSTPDNPELRAAESQLAARRAQLQQLTNGAQPRTSIFVPVERGVELRIASTRVERQYQQDQRVYASLSAALEDAQIDASNSLPVLSVLDSAVVPGAPTRDVPTTGLLGLFGGLVLGVLAVFVGDLVVRMRRDPVHAEFFAPFAGAAGAPSRPDAHGTHAA